MRQITELAKPFPQRFIHENPSGGGSYVAHHVVTQKMILTLGAPPSFTLVQVIRGDVAGIEPNPQGKSARAMKGAPPLTNVVVAVIGRMNAYIDDLCVTIEEVGDCEEPHNWKTDGQRLKDAMSDAYKRCAMRLGCGLHLWAQNDFILYDQLARQDSEAEQDAAATEADPAASKDSEGAGPSENGDSQSSPAAPSEATQESVW